MSVRAVLAVWSLALLAAVGAVALILASDRPRPVASIPLEVLVGLAFVGSGLLARVRRPENRTGLLMILVGFAWFGGALTAADQSLPYTVGYADGALIGAFSSTSSSPSHRDGSRRRPNAAWRRACTSSRSCFSPR